MGNCKIIRRTRTNFKLIPEQREIKSGKYYVPAKTKWKNRTARKFEKYDLQYRSAHFVCFQIYDTKKGGFDIYRDA